MSGLPDFLVIGAPKSGTTSLYRYLESHPDVYLSPVKEPRYFAFPDAPPAFAGPGGAELNRDIVWRFDEYRALFAAREAGHRAAGEASATYLWAPGTARRVARSIPDARLVAILRQPADRAYSHYCQNRAAYREPLASFAEALAAEPERRRLGWSFNLYYVERGRYAAQLDEYLRHFRREQILVLLHDDLARDAASLMARVCDHIGISAEHDFDLSVRHNERRGRPRSIALHRALTRESAAKSVFRRLTPERAQHAVFAAIHERNSVEQPALDPAERDRLTDVFRDDILRLEELIGRDLGHWLAPSATP